MDLITGPLDRYDYMTFVFLVVAVVALFYAVIQIGGLPGKLAERRNHPHAESVKIVGWIGLFTVFPWIHALIWAYHDSVTVDLRKTLGANRREPAGKPPEPAAGTPPPGEAVAREPAAPSRPEA